MIVWRKIVGFDDYEVSNRGEVRSLKHGRERTLKSPLDSWKYPTVYLYRSSVKSTFNVHRLVALAFLGPRPEGMQINHIDGDKLNASIENLEYVTASENIRHSFRLGMHPRRYGAENQNSKLTAGDVSTIRRLKQSNVPTRDVAKQFSVCDSTIERIINGKYWQGAAEMNTRNELGNTTAKNRRVAG